MPSRFWEHLRRIARWVIEPSDSLRDPIVIRRAQVAAAFSALGILLSLAGVLIAIGRGMPVWFSTSLSLLALALTLAYIFSRSANYRAGIGWLVGGSFLWGLVYPLFDIHLLPLSLLLLVGSALVLAGALLSLQTTALLTAGVILYALLLPISPDLGQGIILAVAGGAVFLGAIATAIFTVMRRAEESQTTELVDLRENLEKRVEEHTAEIREAVAIGQVVAAAGSMEEIARLVSRLIPSRLGFYASRLFLLDESGRYLVEQVVSEEGTRAPEKGLRVEVGSNSIVGWAAQNRLLRAASQTSEDALQIEKALVEGAQSQIVIPLMVREVLVGVLDVQSEKADTFEDWSVAAILQILANQIAVSVQNARRFRTAQFGVEDVSELYRSSYPVIQAQSEEEVLAAVRQVFARSPYLSFYLVAEDNGLRLQVGFDPLGQEEGTFPERVAVSIHDLEDYLTAGLFMADGPRLQALPYELVRLLRRFDIFSAAMLPVRLQDEIGAVMIVGTRETRPLSESSVQPYLILSNLVADTLTRIEEERRTRRRMVEMGILARAGQECLAIREPESLYRKVHEYVQEALGQVSFQVVLYQADTGTLRIPYLFDKDREGGEVGSVEAFPLGEGLTSVVVRTKQALLLADRVNERAEALGVRVVNEKPVEAWELAMLSHTSPAFVARLARRAPKSWLGVPLVAGEVVLGALVVQDVERERAFNEHDLEFLQTLAKLGADTLTRIEEERQAQRRMAEIAVLTRATQEFARLTDSESLYRKVHEYVQEALGQVSFQVVLYQADTGTLRIPYLFDKDREGGEVGSVEAFPLGEGLTSVVVRTKQALLLADRVNERAEALGVRVVNEKPVEAWELAMLSHTSPAFVARLARRAPKSWLGVPLVAGEVVLGALVVQDVERERAFNEHDLEFLQTLATQAGNALQNLRLIEETRRRAIQLQTAAEIAREISLSLNVDEVLQKAVNLIRERFNFYHAAVFLMDAANEYAVVREATGEAGEQMKRAGHRLKVGSTSIVGYVTGSGEPLIVNDTSRDATYYPNPLLPETRAEAALPLKVGTRILGALDVQSTRPYSFTEDSMEVLRILADQLAVAVINSELFAETQEHLSQHRLLHHVTTAAASGTTMEEALAGAARGLQVTLGGDRVTILLADAEKRVLRVRAYAGYSEEIARLEIPFGQGITGWVAENRQLLRVNDVTQDPRYWQVSSDVRSELAIPLLYRGELLGVLNVASEQLGAYDESDEEMLGTLAGSLAAIIANARLLDQVRRQVERERLIYELTNRIRRATSMQGVMATTVSELSKVLGARRARIQVGLEEPEEAGGENGGENAPGGGGP